MKIPRPFLLFFYLFMTNFLYALEANISYATFKGMEQENYIEVYLHIQGKTVEFEKREEGYQAAIEVTLLFKQEGDIKKFDKYVLKSPEISSLNMANLGIVDLKRLHLPNGDYSLEVQLSDLNDLGNKNKYRTKLSMNYSNETIQISDIELLGSFKESQYEDKYSKHGFTLKPYPYTTFPSYQKKLAFFTEVYNLSLIHI